MHPLNDISTVIKDAADVFGINGTSEMGVAVVFPVSTRGTDSLLIFIPLLHSINMIGRHDHKICTVSMCHMRQEESTRGPLAIIFVAWHYGKNKSGRMKMIEDREYHEIAVTRFDSLHKKRGKNFTDQKLVSDEIFGPNHFRLIPRFSDRYSHTTWVGWTEIWSLLLLYFIWFL